MRNRSFTECVPILIILFLTLSVASVAHKASAAVQTEKTASVPAAVQFLADIHKEKNVECASCHGKDTAVDDNETLVNQKCVDCHGTLDKVALAKKSYEEDEPAGEVEHALNPHKSHLGKISCTACHHGHVTSWAYCLQCHHFEMKIPGGTVAAELPPAPKREMPIPEIPKDIKTETTDVVVIGAGGAGYTAAITAHDSGAKVILLEKQPIPGGNTMLAAGGMNAAETRFQKEKGIKDSVDLMFEDTMKGGQNLNDPALVKILAKNSAGSIDWLTSLGADMSDVGRMGGSSVNRTHRPKGGAAVGAHLNDVLKMNAEKRKIDVRVNSKVVKILEDDRGGVIGVVVEGKHSKLYRILAKAVVNTAGGFSANPEKVAYYKPELKGMTTSNQPGATGDGVDLGAAAGGQLMDMDQIQIHPTVSAGSRILITEAVRGNGAILVNAEGKRFVNELSTRDKVSAAILSQTNKSAFLIFDEGIQKSLKQIHGYFVLDLVSEGATVKDLAAKIKVPTDALETTLETYNKAYDQKNDTEFKRPDMPRPIRTPGFYAIEIRPGVHYTMGGLKINTDAQVMSKDGVPIKGFFAAGEVTGGVHGANRLGGNSISETITFGRIAGENAAKMATATKP